MKLDLFKEVKSTLQKLDVQDFINELSEHLKKYIGKNNNLSSSNTEKNIHKITEDLNYLRQEDCLYYVVEGNLEFAYLQNLNVDVTFKEINLPEELKGKIWKDDFLIYKNGKYVLEKKLKDDLYENLISISEYKKIQEEFIRRSKIEENSPDIRYKVLTYNEEKETTTLYYEDNGEKEIEVPNKLLPHKVYEWKIFYYEDGKFKTDIEATKESYEKWENQKE